MANGESFSGMSSSRGHLLPDKEKKVSPAVQNLINQQHNKVNQFEITHSEKVRTNDISEDMGSLNDSKRSNLNLQDRTLFIRNSHFETTLTQIRRKINKEEANSVSSILHRTSDIKYQYNEFVKTQRDYKHRPIKTVVLGTAHRIPPCTADLTPKPHCSYLTRNNPIPPRTKGDPHRVSYVLSRARESLEARECARKNRNGSKTARGRLQNTVQVKPQLATEEKAPTPNVQSSDEDDSEDDSDNSSISKKKVKPISSFQKPVSIVTAAEKCSCPVSSNAKQSLTSQKRPQYNNQRAKSVGANAGRKGSVGLACSKENPSLSTVTILPPSNYSTKRSSACHYPQLATDRCAQRAAHATLITGAVNKLMRITSTREIMLLREMIKLRGVVCVDEDFEEM